MSFVSEPKTNMQVYLSHMPMTQAPLTVQPESCWMFLDWNHKKHKFTSRTQFKTGIHKGGSKEACCDLTICKFLTANTDDMNSSKVSPKS